MKVAILGGGPAGLAAAWHLLQQDPTVEITVYQQGWRLGGKGASSRGTNGRIEEHGIHLFGNFYGNARRMLDAIYSELDLSFDDELAPNNLHLSPLPEVPARFASRVAAASGSADTGTEDNIQPSLIRAKLIEAVVESFLGMTRLPDGPPTRRQAMSARVRRSIADRLAGNVIRRGTASTVPTPAPGDPGQDAPDYTAAIRTVRWLGMAAGVAGWLAWMSPQAGARHAQIDLRATVMRGVKADGVFELGIATLDDETNLDWLARHGAASNVPDRTGDPKHLFPVLRRRLLRPMSAAAFVMFLLRQLAAPGPNFWYFKRGTGESVILPLYDALASPPLSPHGAPVRRPVRFEFFTRVKDVVPEKGVVRRVVLRRHASPIDGIYDPVVDDGTGRHWPARPVLDRIEPSDREGIEGVDLEDWYALLHGEPGRDETLELGTDFDHVVLAIPPPTHRHSCPSLAGEQWSAQVAQTEWVSTCGVQLWLRSAGTDLGLPLHPYRTEAERFSTAEWLDPLSCWVDFSDLLTEEDWPSPEPGTLVYFCGPLATNAPDPAGPNIAYPDIARGQALLLTASMLRSVAGLIPGLGADPFGQLVAPDDLVGPARLASQHIRANVTPTDRYGISPPRSIGLRPRADASDLPNLTLAGDWLNTGLNINSFEGAVISGALAAKAVNGSQDLDDIIGYRFLNPPPA